MRDREEKKYPRAMGEIPKLVCLTTTLSDLDTVIILYRDLLGIGPRLREMYPKLERKNHAT